MTQYVENTGNISKGKMRDRVNLQSSLSDAFDEVKKEHMWAENTVSTYARNTDYLTKYLEERGIDPILENIDYEIGINWVNHLHKTVNSTKTIKNMVASVSSIFSFLRDIGVVSLNPFISIEISVNDEGHHSRVILFEELYQIYSLVNGPSFEGISLPVYIAMFNGSRNNNLCKLKMESVLASQMELQYGLSEKPGEEQEEIIGIRNNRKNKRYSTPVPPRLMAKIQEHISLLQLKEGDPLLYGTNGKPLANKQFNYIVKRICHELGWDKEEEKITPHAFRYTYSTLLAEMGVSDEALRYGLGHSDHHKGALSRYVRFDHRYKKELKTAQIVLEEVFEALKKLEVNDMLRFINLKQVHEELPDIYQRQIRNGSYIAIYVNSIFERANALWRRTVMKPAPYVDQNSYQNPYGYSPQGPNQHPFGFAPQLNNQHGYGYQQPGSYPYSNTYIQAAQYQDPSMLYYQVPIQQNGSNMNPIHDSGTDFMNQSHYPPAMNVYSGAQQDWKGSLHSGNQANHAAQGNYLQPGPYSGNENPGHIYPSGQDTQIRAGHPNVSPTPLMQTHNGYNQPYHSMSLTEPLYNGPSHGLQMGERPNSNEKRSQQSGDVSTSKNHVMINGFTENEQERN